MQASAARALRLRRGPRALQLARKRRKRDVDERRRPTSRRPAVPTRPWRMSGCVVGHVLVASDSATGDRAKSLFSRACRWAARRGDGEWNKHQQRDDGAARPAGERVDVHRAGRPATAPARAGKRRHRVPGKEPEEREVDAREHAHLLETAAGEDERLRPFSSMRSSVV